MASTPETQRDIAAARDDRTIATSTAQVAAAVDTNGAAGFLAAGDRTAVVGVVNNNRTRIAEIITALEKVGIIVGG